MKRESFIFYRSFLNAIKELPDDIQLEVFRAVCEYGLNQIEPGISGISKAVFTLIKPQIDANYKRYKNGLKGGRPKTKTEPKKNLTETKPKPRKNQTKTNPEPNDNVNVNENVNVNKKKESVKEKSLHTPPEISDLFFSVWAPYWKNKTGEKMTKPTELEQLKKLIDISGENPETAKEIISNAIGNNWKSFWRLKNPKPERTGYNGTYKKYDFRQ